MEPGTENTLVGKTKVVPANLMVLTFQWERPHQVTSVPGEGAKDPV